MTDFIEREAALSHPFANGHYDHEHAPKDFILGYESYKEWLEQLPVADVAPVIHGKWCHETNDDWLGTICSACRYGFSDRAYHEVSEFNFCPNCGAKMEVEVQDA